MDIETKKSVVEEYKRIGETATAIVLLSHNALTVEESTRIRRDLEGFGARMRVLKNTLFARAVAGTPLNFLAAKLTGPLAAVYTTGDPVGLAKGTVGVLKTNQKLGYAAGALGQRPLTEEELKVLATLPPLQNVRAMFVGALAAVPGKFLGVLQAPARDFLGVLKARARALSGEG